MTTNKKTARDQIFISYSHADTYWYELLETSLKALERHGQIEVWSDKKITTGQKWKAEIEKALARAKVAVLLISNNFLVSDFIADRELPPLYKAAESEGLTLVLVPVEPSVVDEIDLGDYQAPIPLSPALSEMELHRAKRELVNIAKEIKRIYQRP